MVTRRRCRDYSGWVGDSVILPADPSGFAQLTSDQVVSANPAVVILAEAECRGVKGDVPAGHPGWSGVSGVSNGAIVELQDYVVSGWGPGVVELNLHRPHRRLLAGCHRRNVGVF